MSWLEAVLLGIVQGLTEFFPVSSSGHLVLTQAVLGVELPGIVFDVAVHVATLVSVLLVYRGRVGALIRGMLPSAGESSWPYLFRLVIATIPAAIVGFSLEDYFEARFDDPVFAATMILVTGCVVWSTRWGLGNRRFGFLEAIPLVVAAGLSLLAANPIPFFGVLGIQTALMAIARVTAPRETNRPDIGWVDAILVGIAQAIAIFPGISRSGSTVVAGIWRRIDPVLAAEFSFLMSIPAIVGAALLQIPDVMSEGMDVAAPTLVAGFLAAGISGVLAIRFFVELLKRRSFHYFAYYCWAVAGLFLLLNR